MINLLLLERLFVCMTDLRVIAGDLSCEKDINYILSLLYMTYALSDFWGL